ncbi:FAD-dependent oxidoreductase [Xanthobacter sediminis]
MTRPIPPAAAVPVPGRGAALTPTRDCDVCIVGDDVAGLLIACELAARGQEVVLFPTPGDAPTLGLDGALAPGFGLSARDLVERLGPANAAELFALSVEAARRGLALAQEADVAVGPKGRLAVARPHVAALLAAEHAAIEGLMPDSSVLLPAADVEDLLGTSAFAAALGLVPAHRLDAGAFRDVLAAAAAEGEITIMPRVTALAADVHGLRKYVTAPGLKVRAFQVVFSGGAALSKVAPELAPSLVPTPWVSGRFRVPGADVPYAGLVEEVGGTGLRWHWDKDRLALAAETATRVRDRVAAARVLRRHGDALAPGIAAAPAEATQGVMLAPTRRLMPLVQEGEKGVWYCATLGGEELAHAILGADLIIRAIADRDDRIRLLEPFGLEAQGARPVSRRAAIAGYWRRRLAEGLQDGFQEGLQAVQAEAGPATSDSMPAAPLPPLRGVHGSPVRRGALALSRRAARVAARLAFGRAKTPSRE